MAKRKSLQGKRHATEMNKHGMQKYVVIPCTIVLIASLIYLIWYINNKNSTYENILYIQSFMNNSGKLNDYSNELGMHDPETDIRWYKTKDEIRIEFGRIYLTWEPEEFYAEENLVLLSTIGFTIEIREDSDGVKTLHLFYMGKECERWVR